MSRHAYRLLHIRQGPMLHVEYDKFKGLSARFKGDIITSSFRPGLLNIREVGGFAFHCLHGKVGVLGNIGFLIYCIYYSINSRIKKEKYDFVWVYDPLKSGLYGIVVSKILGCKLIVEVNGVFTSPAVYIDEGERLSTTIKKHMFPVIERVVLNRAHGIRLLFQSQIDCLSIVTKGKTISCFPAYVNIEKYIELPFDVTNKLILFVGFPFKLKGVDILIDAFKKIGDTFPEWKLRILGWYPDPKELMDCIGGHPQIEHRPPVEYRDMPAQMAECGILVLPSRTEAMGRVLVESMAAGKPRIGSNIDGIPTVINDNEDGFLFEPGNSDHLASRLAELMSNEPLRRRMGESGRHRAVKEFSKAVHFENFFRFFDDVMAGEIYADQNVLMSKKG